MSLSSQIGFHAAYQASDRQVSGPGNAMVGAYLSELGMPLSAVEFVTEAKPNDATWLSVESAGRVGIPVVPLDDNGGLAETPKVVGDKPTVDARIYQPIAIRAAKALQQTYQSTGMAGLRDAVEACYPRARTLKSTKALAYCYIFDLMSFHMDSEGAKMFNGPTNPFFTIQSVNARTDEIFNAMSYSIADRRSLTNVWDSLAVAALRK